VTLAVGGCTVATRSYLADARLAARSFVDHHPGSRFTIVVVDGDHMPPATWTHRDVELVTPTELGLPEDELLRMAAIYSPFEIACALKPLALRRTLEQADVGVYVDGDVEVLDPMDELIAGAAEHDVVLVPHVLDPVPRDGRLPDEPGLLGAGMFNGGLLAVRRGSGPFLDWWEERLRRDALGRPDMMMLADQRWLDFVPVLFDHVVLRDPTYDLAYWNLHERPTAWVDGRLCVVDRPVRCFHYSGLTDARPWLLSGFAEDRPRVALADVPAVARQCRGWLERRRAVDAEADRALGYHWSRTARGVPVDRRARMLFRDALLAAEADATGRTPAPPDPFADDEGEAWEAWLRTPAADDDVGPYLAMVRAEAPDLQRRFPEVPGDDAAALLAWAAGDEADAAEIPDALRPLPEEVPVTGAATRHTVRTPPLPDAAAQRPIEAVARAQEAAAAPPVGPPGVAGKVVDRLLAGRDRRHEGAVAALTDAVAELADRLAALSDRVDRTNDRVHDGSVRVDRVEAADAELRAVGGRLARRADEVAADVDALRADVAGAHEQDRITAAIVGDAEARLLEQVAELRQRLDKLTADAEPGDDIDPTDPTDPAGDSDEGAQP
jgi:hypothetical protein